MSLSHYSHFSVFDLFGKIDSSFFSHVGLYFLEKEESILRTNIKKPSKIIRVR